MFLGFLYLFIRTNPLEDVTFLENLQVKSYFIYIFSLLLIALFTDWMTNYECQGIEERFFFGRPSCDKFAPHFSFHQCIFLYSVHMTVSVVRNSQYAVSDFWQNCLLKILQQVKVGDVTCHRHSGRNIKLIFLVSSWGLYTTVWNWRIIWNFTFVLQHVTAKTLLKALWQPSAWNICFS
jgi:hypothetical protein